MSDQTPAQKPLGLMARAARAVAYTITGIGSDTWMSPNQPLHPMAEQTKGRVWDYPVSYNINYIPRSTEPLSFLKLKNLAEYGIVREVIQTRIDQVCSVPWGIRPKEASNQKGKRLKTTKYQAQIDEVTDFMAFPDKRLDWQQWLAQGLEQHFVYDGWAIEKQKTRAKKPYAWKVVDSATIKLLIDQDGRPHPPPPSPAYQQVLKGMPASNYSSSSWDKEGPSFTTGDMLYMAKNVRVDRAYGFPPVAQIFNYVEMCLARSTEQLSDYTHGNQPVGTIQAPSGLTNDQIASLQSYWDSMYAGNIQQRRRLLWVPNGSKLEEANRELLFNEFDEWLARVVCYAFSISPQPFVKMMNRATAETAQDTATEEGNQPTLNFVERLVNRLVYQEFGYDFLEFSWSRDNEVDMAKKAIQDNTYVRIGAKSLDDVRDDIGLDPLGGAYAIPMFATPTGYVPVDPQEAQELQAAAAPALAGAGQPGQKPIPGAKPGQPGKNATNDNANTPPGKAKAPQDNASKSLMISRPLLNGHDVVAWAKAQGLQVQSDTSAMKVQLAYSRQAVDWHSIGEAEPIVLFDTGHRAIKVVDGLLVLKFEAPEFEARWGDIIARGAGCEAPDFNACIIVAKSDEVSGTKLEKGWEPTGQEGVDREITVAKARTLGDIEPYSGQLIFGPEEWSEIEDHYQRMLTKLDRGDVDAAAAEANASPSQAQIEAGNYKKGHIVIQGLDISIENAAGSERKGVAPNGSAWSVTMPTHYGYIKQTRGADDEQVDVYIGPNPDSDKVWIIDQAHHDTKGFDEHKVMLGYDNWREAQQDYLNAFSDGKGQQRIGAVLEMSISAFKDWLKDGDLSKPVAMKSVSIGTGLTHHDEGTGSRAAPFQRPQAHQQPSPYPETSPDIGNFDPRTDVHDGYGYFQRLAKSHPVLEPGPQKGDLIEVKSDAGVHDSAPYSSGVIEGDNYSARIEYDKGAEWHHYDPDHLVNVKLRDDGSHHWQFAKTEHVTHHAIDWKSVRKLLEMQP